MELSNRILASFLVAFIISIAFGTTWVLNEIDLLTGNVGKTQQAQVSVTVAGVCGDNTTKGSSETCDGTDLKNETCVTQGFDAGTLSCASNCHAFVTSQCINATVTEVVAAAAVGKKTEGEMPLIIYNADLFDTFDFKVNKAIPVYIIFKEQKYLVTIDDVGDKSAILRITKQYSTESQIIYFDIYQTKPVDLDKDGILDIMFTLTDILTRRAIFHMERIKLAKGSPITVSQLPKFESPKQITDFNQYYKESFLLLAVIILALINFAIFKKFIVSKK